MPITNTAAEFAAITNRDAAIADWVATKAEFNRLQQLEREKRALLYQTLFPGNVDTTETIDLGGDFKFKATGTLNYKLKFSKKENGADDLNAALDAIEKTGNEGTFIAERLVTWSPELAVGEYKKLAADSPIKAAIDAVLTITPGSPTLELVKPKT
jgi:hypothetical protein